MKRFILVPLMLAGCATPIKKEVVAPPLVEKKAEAPVPPKPQPKAPPVQITEEPKSLADIDPDTLKVTYHKGSDPKAVVDQVVKAWAQNMNQLQACQGEVQRLMSQKK